MYSSKVWMIMFISSVNVSEHLLNMAESGNMSLCINRGIPHLFVACTFAAQLSVVNSRNFYC